MTPDETPEAKHLLFNDSYRKALIALFKGLVGAARETHAKQLGEKLIGANWGRRRRKLVLRPVLTVEPLPTYYLRQAKSYRFVRSVLEEFLGRDAWPGLHRLTPDGPVSIPLDRELRLIEGLFHGAYCASAEEIGMPVEGTESLGSGAGPAADQDLLHDWWATAEEDADLSQDIRMMVPIFYDLGRKKTKVWIILGLLPQGLTIDYDRHPRVTDIRLDDGTALNPAQVEIEYSAGHGYIANIVSAELYVDEILDREAFRAHCDRYKTVQAIVDNLRPKSRRWLSRWWW